MLNSHYIGEMPIISSVLKDVGDLEGGVFATGIALAMRLLRDLLDNEIRHGEEDKPIARDHLIKAEADHPYVARGASLAIEGNESSHELSVVALVATA
jgi:hypothetical protein